MKVTRLRLHGFKSFVDSTDIPVESGLTGIVGPNGCGKSNLVEALRFVMGESSYKALRGGGMDDVIFAGSSGRPARNIAEVTLLADQERSAGGREQLEITRRIEREAGSFYRVNGREARARDVQLLFADAASGPRSSALVRQGQIGELIAAKPVQRRIILEDAAGISGLHPRRGEAEGKLKAAEANIERLDDVMNEVAVQLEALRRQARQAVRYRTLSLDIRRTEALLRVLQWESVLARQRAAETELQRATQALAEAAAAQTASARDEAVAAAALPELRDRSVAAGAALRRLESMAQEVERDEARLKGRREELVARRSQTAADLIHEGDLGRDAAEALRAVEVEAARLSRESADHAGRLESARQKSDDAALLNARSEAAFAEASATLAVAAAERGARERAVREAEARLTRLASERAGVIAERDNLAGAPGRDVALEAGRARLAEVERRCAAGDAKVQAAEAALLAAREAETRHRAPFEAAEKMLAGLEVEGRTLARVLDSGGGTQYQPVTDLLDVASGYEQALVAALGDDLEASVDSEAPTWWGECGSLDRDPVLPLGADPLALHVTGPDTLLRRLRQIGVVDDDAGESLISELAAGQRLVSLGGALWRWDGLRVAAGAATAAARRLEQKNRAAALVGEMKAAQAAVTSLREAFETSGALRVDAERFERDSRDEARQARREMDAARAALTNAEREAARAGDRMAALAGALERLDAAETAAGAELASARKAMASLPETTTFAGKREALQRRLDKDRAASTEARLDWETARHEETSRNRRLGELGAEQDSWGTRTGRALERLAELQKRAAALDLDIAAAGEEPEQFAARRRVLAQGMAEAAKAASLAADRFAAAETAHRSLAAGARQALEALSKARADHARDNERVLAASGRCEELERSIREAYNRPPHALRALADVAAEALLPEAGALEGKLERLKGERERLGAVNLRAEDEAQELDERAETMRREREDLEGAIRQLRHVIQTLNREGRERLLAAFDAVNGHFRALFHHLFGGGTAELTLTGSEDALEAGLEIVARPPGKKPQIMTLLSGGEQALTAMSLIFAVFLTNPSPICVLDEVDAPLDDANVERFCALLDEMRRRTETRFIVVTHNPITMARMDRLYGVTMAEKGVSQLVTVDLQSGERLREAG